MKLRISLAYEMGILTKPNLNHIQQWALAYYLYMERENRRLELMNQMEGIQFFINPKLFKALNFPEENNTPEDEISEDIPVEDLGELDKLLKSLDGKRQSQQIVNDGEWI